MEDVVGERADTRDDNNSSIFEIVGGEITAFFGIDVEGDKDVVDNVFV